MSDCWITRLFGFFMDRSKPDPLPEPPEPKPSVRPSGERRPKPFSQLARELGGRPTQAEKAAEELAKRLPSKFHPKSKNYWDWVELRPYMKPGLTDQQVIDLLEARERLGDDVASSGDGDGEGLPKAEHKLKPSTSDDDDPDDGVDGPNKGRRR